MLKMEEKKIKIALFIEILIKCTKLTPINFYIVINFLNIFIEWRNSSQSSSECTNILLFI